MAIIIKAVGVTYRNEDGIFRQELIKKLNVGDFVNFIEEPNNPRDSGAISIRNDAGKTLGYIGSDDPQRELIRRAMRRNDMFATIIEIPGRYPHAKRTYTEGLCICVGTVAKDGDGRTITFNKPVLSNTEQKPKRPGKEWRATLVKIKRHHPARLTYQEIKSLRERSVG